MTEFGIRFKQRGNGVVDITVDTGKGSDHIYSYATARFSGSGWSLEWRDDLPDLQLKLRLTAVIIFAVSNLTV